MKLIVTDANILIFLSLLDLVDSFFAMDFEIHTTDYIINEYKRGGHKETNLKNLDKYIRSKKLNVHEYDYEAVFEIYEQKKSLSPSDCSIYLLSSEIKAILLTGDKQLKQFSENSGVEVHDFLWLIDEMLHSDIIDKIEFKEKLMELKGLSERLPVEEIDRRLK